MLSSIPADILAFFPLIDEGEVSHLDQFQQLFPSNWPHPYNYEDPPFFLSERGVPDRFSHLFPLVETPFNDVSFSRMVQDDCLSQYVGRVFPTSHQKYQAVRLANALAIRELNKFLFRVDNNGKFVCALIDQDHQMGWNFRLMTTLPRFRFLKNEMHKVVSCFRTDDQGNQSHFWDVSPNEKELIDIWLKDKWEETAHINQVVFNPKSKGGLPPPNRNSARSFPYYNQWRGMPFYEETLVENREHLSRLDESLSLFLFHVFHVICNRDFEATEYLLDWIAYRRMFPWLPMEILVLIVGPQGTGKTEFMRILEALFGQEHSVYYQDPKKLEETFNWQLENKVLVMVDEVEMGPQNTSLMKTMITGGKLDINRKFHDQRQVDNCIGLMISSNQEQTAVPQDLLKRRVFLVSVNRVPLSFDYFDKLVKLKKNKPFLRDLDHYFHRRATRPIFSHFQIRARPLTEGFRAAVRFQQQGVRRWLDVASQARNIYIGTNEMLRRDSRPAEGNRNYQYNTSAPLDRNSRHCYQPDSLWPSHSCLQELFDNYREWKHNLGKLYKKDEQMDCFVRDLSLVFQQALPPSYFTSFPLPEPAVVQQNIVDWNEYLRV